MRKLLEFHLLNTLTIRTNSNMGFLSSSDISNIFSESHYASKNLYTVEITDVDSTSPDSDFSTKYLKFQSPSISFKGETFSLQRNDITKYFQADDSGKAFTWADTLRITWRERDDWKVRKYHEDWIGKLYDRQTDTFLSLESDNDKRILNRSITITLPSSLADPNAANKIKFNDVIPQNFGDLELAWGTGADTIEHQITYYVRTWEWARGNE